MSKLEASPGPYTCGPDGFVSDADGKHIGYALIGCQGVQPWRENQRLFAASHQLREALREALQAAKDHPLGTVLSGPIERAVQAALAAAEPETGDKT